VLRAQGGASNMIAHTKRAFELVSLIFRGRPKYMGSWKGTTNRRVGT
jgi:hypothetical protein